VTEADIELRRAHGADTAEIRALVRDAYASWAELIGREPKPMTADYDAAILNHRLDLAVHDGRLVGVIETVDEGGQLLIENVAVAPEFQRRGVGRMLMAHAELIALDLGRPRIRLYTNQQFTPNIRFYQGLGYRIDREEDLGSAIAVHMSKALAAAGGLRPAANGFPL